jgi:hypothetical protein
METAMPRLTMILYFLAYFFLGLGIGTGWVPQATDYPAIFGTGFGLLGCFLLLAATMFPLRRKR